MVIFLCSRAKVSRTGYYNYLNSEEIRRAKESKDLEAKSLILKAFNRRGFKKGARSIRMILENEFNIIDNLKKIRRIMRKYKIICPHRRPTPYKNIAKATKEHRTVPKTLERNFKQGIPRKVLLTDITYLGYGDGKRAYLSPIKDSCTNEIIFYEVSSSLHLEISLNTVKHLTLRKFQLASGCLIHSNQGSHYTNPKFQALLNKKNIEQSMSRKGNCWDNAPMESFYGHTKDNLDLKPLKTLDEVKKK